MAVTAKALSEGSVISSEQRVYRVERVLGSGGFGITYVASAPVKVGNVTGRMNFAVKEHFLSELCERDTVSSRVVYSNPVRERVENSMKDFISEARRLHKVGIEHPNIVKVNEVFEANNTAYYVMEYLDGESLRSYVRRHGPLSESEMLAVMRPVIDAVGYLHRNRMTHLDVKPDNIMIVHDDEGNLRPVLIDFGLSKHYGADGRPTSTINTLGCSDGYAPMEQYSGITTFSPTADIYALGATMLFCLTGCDPKKSTELRPGEIAGLLGGLAIAQPLRETIARAMTISQYDRTQSVSAMFDGFAMSDDPAANGGIPTVPFDSDQHDGGQADDSDGLSRRLLIIGAAVAALLILGGIFLFTRGGSDSEEDIIVADSATVAVVDSQQPVGAGHGLPADNLPAAEQPANEQISTAEPAAPAAPATVDVRGRVTDAATNRPVKGAKVSAQGVKTVTTGNDGAFLLPAVAPGRTVTVRYDGTDLYTFAAPADGSTQNIAVRLPEPEQPADPVVEQPTAVNSTTETVNGLTVNWGSDVTAAQKDVLRNLINNMVYVAGGTFTMGATSEQGSDADSDEKPVHSVTLSGYRIGRYEVSQKEWQTVMGSNPSYFKGDNLPVEKVSYNDCKSFISRLNSMTGLHFRLPTEAQWEYAARGGSRSNGYKYSGGNDISSVAWYDGNSGGKTHPVGTKRANELGLYDMSGNVWEWCNDWNGDYSSASQTNPSGASSGSIRVLRGGSWFNNARNCRVSNRYYASPGYSDFSLGLRLAL